MYLCSEHAQCGVATDSEAGTCWTRIHSRSVSMQHGSPLHVAFTPCTKLTYRSSLTWRCSNRQLELIDTDDKFWGEVQASCVGMPVSVSVIRWNCGLAKEWKCSRPSGNDVGAGFLYSAWLSMQTKRRSCTDYLSCTTSMNRLPCLESLSLIWIVLDCSQLNSNGIQAFC